MRGDQGYFSCLGIQKMDICIRSSHSFRKGDVPFVITDRCGCEAIIVHIYVVSLKSTLSYRCTYYFGSIQIKIFGISFVAGPIDGRIIVIPSVIGGFGTVRGEVDHAAFPIFYVYLGQFISSLVTRINDSTI